MNRELLKKLCDALVRHADIFEAQLGFGPNEQVNELRALIAEAGRHLSQASAEPVAWQDLSDDEHIIPACNWRNVMDCDRHLYRPLHLHAPPAGYVTVPVEWTDEQQESAQTLLDELRKSLGAAMSDETMIGAIYDGMTAPYRKIAPQEAARADGSQQ